MIRKLLVCLSALCLLSACSNSSPDSKTKDYAMTGFPGISADGIYHHTRDQSYDKVYFYDFESDADVPLCSKVNCNHENEECDAYKLSFYKSKELPLHQDPVVYGDRLYLFYEDMAKGSVTLCSSDIDGANRKELTSFKKNTMIESSMFYDGKLWYTSNTFTIDEKGNTATSYGNNYEMNVVDLKTMEITNISNVKTSAYYFMGCSDENIILSHVDHASKKDAISLESMNTKEYSKTVLSKDSNTYNSYVVDGNQYYFDNKNHKIYQIKLNDMKKVEFLDVDVHKDYDVFSYSNDTNGIMELRLDKDKKTSGSIYLDLEEKKQLDTNQPIYCKADGSYFTLQDDQMLKRLK